MKYSDKYKKILDGIVMDKLMVDGEIKKEEEEAIKQVKREALKEKEDLGAFVIPIRLEAKINLNSLADTDMPIDKDVPILVGRGFLYTCGSILNIRDRITSSFDGFCHQTIHVAKTSLNTKKSDTDDEEEYGIQRNNFGAPMYQIFKCSYEYAIENMLEVRVDKMGSDEVLFTFEAWKCAFDINEPIYTKLCHEFYASFEFDEAMADDELMTKKAIKFRLCGKAYAMSILDFAKRLGLYTSAEIQDYGFETNFIGGLRNDDDFNADQYWLNISSYDKRESLINYEEFVTRTTKRLGILSDEVLNGLSAPTYCRTLDANILRELISSNERLIPEEITPSIRRVATPRAPRPTTSDLYDKISQLETRLGKIERMTHRQSYHSDKYARVLEHIASNYEVTLDVDHVGCLDTCKSTSGEIQFLSNKLDIIENGNSIPKTQTVNDVETVIPPTTTEERLQRINKVKARSTLMMRLPNEHHLKFNLIKDAKSLLAAIEKSTNTQNMAFVSSSSNNFNNSNGVNTPQGVNTTNGVNTASSKSNSTKLVNEDLEKIHPDDLEEMDLNWQMAMLTMQARIFLKNTGMKLNLTGNDSVGFDKSKVECYNCHKRGHFTRECRAQRGHINSSRDVIRKTVPIEAPNSSVLVSCDRLGGYDRSLFPPPKSELSSTGLEEFFNEPKTKKSKDKSNEVEPESVRKLLGICILYTNDVSTAYSVSSPSALKSQKEKSSSYTDEVIHSFFVNQSSAPQLDYDDLEQINDDVMEEMYLKWHFARDCRAKGNQDSKRRDAGYNGNNTRDNGRRPAYQDDSKALITIDGEDIDWSGHVEEDAIVEITAYTLALKKVEAQLLCHQENQLAYEQKIRFIKIDLDDKTDVLAYHKKLLAEDLKEKEDLKTKFENWQNSSENLSRLLNTQMSANDKFGLGYGYYRYGSILSYENEVLQSVFINKASDLEDTPVNDRFAYGIHVTSADESDSKPSEYASCESNSSVETSTSLPEPVENTSKVVYEPKVLTDAPIIDEYESDSDNDSMSNVQEDKEKPSFAFTNFVKHVKLLGKILKKQAQLITVLKLRSRIEILTLERVWDMLSLEKHVLFVDDPHRALKDNEIVDSRCSKHMTGNKAHLADYQEFKGGSVAFGGSNGRITSKGKKKTGRKESKTRPLESRGSIVMPELHNKMELLREKNMTLIKAARTMLADSFLPTTFWAETVTIACYVLNRVLVTKPQNKTPYELLTGKQPIISYLRPFGCHVTILNTIDQLGKFDGKSNLGVLVGYSLNSKAFRVYNLETKRVKENLHVNFLENKPNVTRKGHAWMFDLDYLTNSMNYEHVSIENQANKFAGLKEANNSVGTQANDDQGANLEEINLNEEHFVLPIWSAYSTVVKSSGDKIEKNTDFKTYEKPVSQVEQVFLEELKKLNRQERETNDAAKLLRKEATHDIQNASTSSTNLINTASTPLSTAGPSRAFNDGELSYPDDPSMPHLEHIRASPSEGIFTDSSYDDVGVVTDFNNLETTMSVKQKEDGIFISQDKYVTKILKKFDFLSVKTASTPIETQKPLVKYEEAADVDVTPKTSHLQAVKRIFRDAYEKKLIQVLNIHTDDNVADLLTKAFDMGYDCNGDYLGFTLFFGMKIEGYKWKMIPEPGDANREITITETFHMQTDDELSDKELKQIEADDQAIQTILLGLPEDIYAAVDSCETAQEIWLRVQQMMKGSDIGIQEKKANQNREVDELKAERLAKTQDPLALMKNSNNPYVFLAPHQDQSSFNQNYLQQPMSNPEDITDPTTTMNMELALMAKAFKLNYSTPTNNNQRISSNPRNRQIAQPSMNMGQDRQMQMVGGDSECCSESKGSECWKSEWFNWCSREWKLESNWEWGVGDYARNCIIRPKKRDAAYLQTQLMIAQKEEEGIQFQAEEYDLMATAADLDEIEEVNANCISMANLQQASTSGTQTDSAPVYDTDGSAENDNVVIFEDTSVEQGGETVEQHPANFEETRALYESLYQNLAIEVEKVNSVNRKLKETNADLTTELAR
nr:ribonuclease H-like domain-containing protein [Tanacetum cinerariifolium]